MLPPSRPLSRGHHRSERSPQRDGRSAPSPAPAGDRNDPPPSGIRTSHSDLRYNRPLSALDESRPHSARKGRATARRKSPPPASAARAPPAATPPPHRR